MAPHILFFGALIIGIIEFLLNRRRNSPTSLGIVYLTVLVMMVIAVAMGFSPIE